MPYKSPLGSLATITNSFIHTLIPSRSEENSSVQYTAGLMDGLVSWLSSSVTQAGEQAQGINAPWPPLLSLHFKLPTARSEMFGLDRIPVPA